MYAVRGNISRLEWRALTLREGGFMLFTCKSRNRRHGQRMILEFQLNYFCFRSPKSIWAVTFSEVFYVILIVTRVSRCVRKYGWCRRQQYQVYPPYRPQCHRAALFVIFGEWPILVTLFPEAVVIGFSIIIIETSRTATTGSWLRPGTKVIWPSVHHPVERDYCKSLVTFSDKDN